MPAGFDDGKPVVVVGCIQGCRGYRQLSVDWSDYTWAHSVVKKYIVIAHNLIYLVIKILVNVV